MKNLDTLKDGPLLKLAGQSVGIALKEEPNSWGYPRYFYRQDDFPSGTDWNPLIMDDDAFRLAIDLGLRIYPPDKEDECAVVRDWDDLRMLVEVENGNAYAATRRAIVLAAAYLGSKSTTKSGK